LYIGASPAQTDECNAYFDELRISNVARSDDWINASYNSSWIAGFCYFGTVETYFTPYVYPVNYTSLSFTNGTASFPLWNNNVNLFLFTEDGSIFNATLTLSTGTTVSFLNCINGTYKLNFSYMLCALSSYTFWVNCSKAPKTYDYWFTFVTGNLSSSSGGAGGMPSSSSMIGMIGIIGIIGIFGAFLFNRKKENI
jgi:hypothetical protein